MYQVLYRRYRPRRFADVIGQPQVTVTLQNELDSGRISHAYLFTGSHGTGKTTCAKILAKAVNCLTLDHGDPCGKCEICKGFEAGTILDVVEIDAASNNGVDHIRKLIEEANFLPSVAKYRVYIVDEVHMLSTAAFNALLKTLEEPPAHVIFILATTEVDKLLPTILSRCQHFPFRRLTPNCIADRLIEVSEAEEVVLERGAAQMIARASDGAMRDALSILDQCMGGGKAITITATMVSETAGVADRSYLDALTDYIIEKNPAGAIDRIHELYMNSKDIKRLCEELVTHFRNLMLVKTMKKPENVLLLPDEEIVALKEQVKKLSLSEVLHALDAIETAHGRMHFGNQRAELEMTFVRLCTPELDDTPESLIRRIEKLEQRPFAVVPNVLTPQEMILHEVGILQEPKSLSHKSTGMPKEKSTVPAVVTAEVGQHHEEMRVGREETTENQHFGTADASLQTESQTERLANGSNEYSMPANKTVSLEKQEATGERVSEPFGEKAQKSNQRSDSRVEKLSSGQDKAPLQTLPPATNQTVEQLSGDAVPFARWNDVITAMKAYSSSISTAFTGSKAYENGGYMLIDAPEIAFNLLKLPSQRDKMRELLRQFTGKIYKLGPYKREKKDKEKADFLQELYERAEKSGIDVTMRDKD